METLGFGMLHSAYIKCTALLEYLAVGQNQFFPKSTTLKEIFWHKIFKLQDSVGYTRHDSALEEEHIPCSIKCDNYLCCMANTFFLPICLPT
jgi:hypothetical protein